MLYETQSIQWHRSFLEGLCNCSGIPCNEEKPNREVEKMGRLSDKQRLKMRGKDSEEKEIGGQGAKNRG